MSGRLFFPSLSIVHLLMGLLIVASSPGPAMAGSAGFKNAALPSAEQDSPLFRTTIRQRHDFSCGAAALATLLIHHYGSDVTDQQVFAGMLREGDEAKIRSEGFSMLDMKRYLDGNGYISSGYEISLDRFDEMALPGVVLITLRGFDHFVVVKGLSPTYVLLGDPVLGIRTISRADFDAIWNGMVLVIRSFPEIGRRSFNRPDEWEAGLGTVASEEWRLPVYERAGTAQSEKGMMSRAGYSGISR